MPHKNTRMLTARLSTGHSGDGEGEEQQLGLVYSRVSTAFQKEHSVNSIEYQRAMRLKLIEAGINDADIVDFDDLGVSGSGGIEREDFNKLQELIIAKKVAAVGIYDISKLGRSQADLHRFFEICASLKVEIVTASKTYAPWKSDDDMSLSFQAIQAKNELSAIKQRTQDGRLRSIQNALMKVPLAVGYKYDSSDKIVFDKDKEIERLIKRIFELMDIYQSAYEVTRQLHREGFQMITLRYKRDPETKTKSKKKYKVRSRPTSDRVRSILKNPIYAGAYTWGRRRYTKRFISITKAKVTGITIRDYNQWIVCKRDHHEGYISWETYRHNVETLRSNSYSANFKGAPREGGALLQGLLHCGKCGAKLEVHYNSYSVKGGLEKTTYYRCAHAMTTHAEPLCQAFVGSPVEEEVIRQVLAVVNTVNIDHLIHETNTFDASESLVISRLEHGVRKKSQEVKARMEEHRSARDMKCNAQVMSELLAQWNNAQNELDSMNKQLQRLKGVKEVVSSSEIDRMGEIPLTLFSILHSADVMPKDKKLIVRQMINKITVYRIKRTVYMQIQWSSGYLTSTQAMMRSHSSWKKSPQETIDFIVKNRTNVTIKALIEMLNNAGIKSFSGKPFTSNMVASIYRNFKQK